MRKLFLYGCLVACVVPFCFAQQGFDLFPGGTYNPTTPSPKSVLGYDIGERFTDFRNLEKYIDKLVFSSNRVKRLYYGETNERRPLQVLIVSSPKNLSKLNEIKSANKKLTDPRTIKSKTEADEIIKTLPAIVWLSYGVHGNESSSPEAAMATAYQLCAGTDARTLNILDNAVIIIDPAVNPDGRERYVQWINSTTGAKPNINPDAVEHSEPWPGGRTNHFYFDLNRDWAWQTQKETQGRIPLYREWMPHVHVDFHEMGYTSTYFFFPATKPFHTTLPTEVKKWGEIFGKGNAEAFDKIGSSYYVAEDFDLFYPGYGDSWPTFNGAIGMTYEQAGHSRAGLAIKKPSGEILTLRSRARNHFTTSIATLETAVKNRQEKIADFYKFWGSGLNNGDHVKGYLIKEGKDPNRAARLISTLLRQGIEVHQLQEAAQIQAQEFYASKPAKENFSAGTYFISTEQPHSRLAKALLEPTPTVKDTFYYDVSAWSLPTSFGLNAFSTETALPQSAKKLTEAPRARGKIIGGKASVAYLIPWETNDAFKLVWQLLEKKYLLSVASRSFETANRKFAPGTVIAAVGLNRDSLHTDIEQLTTQYGVQIYAVNSGLTEKGISLGSNRVDPIKKPEIAIMTGAPVNSNDYGELWYLLEQELGISFTGIRATELTDLDVSKYDVIIFPDGGNYQSVFDSAKVDKLKRWVQGGGVLIGIEGGAQFLAKSKSGITSAILKSEKKEEDKSKEEKEQEKAKKELAKHQTLYEKEEQARLERIPGTIFKVFVDNTHPIGYGYDNSLYVLKGDAIPFELSDVGHNVARFTRDSLQISGYSPKEKSKKIADSGYILDFRVGRGHAVLFTESITFRMFWNGLPKLLMNSILFLPQP